MKVLVTGAKGFIGQNLALRLGRMPDHEILALDRESTEAKWLGALAEAEIVYHLAGINRPPREEDFEAGNVELTAWICAQLAHAGRPIPVVLASSTQAVLDNPYGASKRRAEDVVQRYAEQQSAGCVVYRFPGVFGKWCRPNYNSVVATFCYNVARDLPLDISDRSRELEITHVGDVVESLLTQLSHTRPAGVVRADVRPTFRVTLGQLADLIQGFRSNRDLLRVSDMSNSLVRRLYCTYQAYVPGDRLEHHLHTRRDARGALAEIIKSEAFGQIFMSRTAPGVTRGNHYHDHKVEKFLVVEGEGLIRLRHLSTGEQVSYSVSGQEFRVIDIPPGWGHAITNVGEREMVVLFWANEVFDPSQPDTYAAGVSE